MLRYIQLLRPLNCLMALIAVLIGGLLVTGADLTGLLSSPLWLALVAVFLITGAGNAFNDWNDIESDRINKPKRPIPSGRVSAKSALVFSLILFFIGIFLAGFINWFVFIIALVNSILLVIYSLWLQNKILLGNGVIAWLVGSTFLFGGAALGNLLLPFLLMLLAFFSVFSREIVKDLEDLEGDRVGFLKTLTSGIKRSVFSAAERFGIAPGGVTLKYRNEIVILAGIALTLAVVISPLPWVLGILSQSYLILLVPTDIIFIFCIYRIGRAFSKHHWSQISKYIKIGMALGLLAFIAGVLI